MKKLLRLLAVGMAAFALLCCTLPAAFAADDTTKNVYFIGLDAQGGTCSTVVVYTNLSGQLEEIPEQPTMDGYTFEGWYTEPAGGSKVSTSMVFTSDSTLYAHWTVKDGVSPTAPEQPSVLPSVEWKKYAAPALVAGALLTTLLVASMM